MRTTTGRSEYRTPGKHGAMYRTFGREIGALSRRRMDCVSGAYWSDLSAGDGAGEPGRPWHESCSPGILAHHARFAGYDKPVYVDLCEKAAATYEALLDNLAENLPGLGYVRVVEDRWQAHDGRVNLRVRNIDSTTIETLDGVPPDWAVMIVNDPNKVSDWAMHPNLMANASAGRWTCLGMSTMGCNVGGLKRISSEERAIWYQHVQGQVDGLWQHHDLLLAAIERDDAQWAYLITAPQKWVDATEQDVRNAFGQEGLSLRCEWLRRDPDAFRDLLDVLFKTRKERAA